VTDLRCVDLVELVTDFVDTALDAGDVRRLADHLLRCEGCQRYVEQVRQTIHVLRHQAADQLLPSARSATLLAHLRSVDRAST